MEKDILLLYNPKAGDTFFRFELERFLNVFGDMGCTVRIFRSQYIGDMAACIRRSNMDELGLIIAAGGDGKTTTTINLAACMAERGQRVLVIDFDPQGNTTSGFGIDKDRMENTSYELLLEENCIRRCILHTDFQVDLIPANMDLSGAEVELIGIEKREYLLKKQLELVKDQYDFIWIDCPPSLNMLTVNAFCSADSVLVPIQCEFYALEGLSQLLNTINLVKRRLNPRVEIEGIVFTMYDNRTNLCNEVVQEVRKYLPDKTYSTMIPRNVRLGEAPSHGEPIIYYDSSSKGAESYRRLAAEILGTQRR